MKKISTLLLASFSFIISLNAQVSYIFSASSGTYTPIVGGTVPALVAPSSDFATPDEGFANSVPIGFTFIYNGVSYNNININANGFISLGEGFAADPNEDYFANNLETGPASKPTVRPIIAPLWADLDLASNDSITYQLSGTAPNQVFTVQWANAHWDYTAGNAGISFQVKLYETTNIIEFIYRQESGALEAPQASIGLTSARTGSGNFLSLSNSSASPAVSSTEQTFITAKPATNQVYRFTPLACIAPSVTQLTNVTNTSATFSWNTIPGAAGYEYATSTSATPPASGTATTSTSADITGLTLGVNTYLYVRTACGGGTFSAWSARAIVGNCTNNILPANGDTTVRPTTISWHAVPGATAYSIMLSSNGTDYNNIGSVPDTTVSLPARILYYNATYSYYVRPVIGSDTASTGCQANATIFIIGNAPVVPCTSNLLPANGDTVYDTHVIMERSRFSHRL